MEVAQGCRRVQRASPSQKLREVLTCAATPCVQTGLAAFRRIEMWVGSLAASLGRCCAPGEVGTGQCWCSQSSRAALTKYQRLSGLNNRNLLSQFPRLEVQDQGASLVVLW